MGIEWKLVAKGRSDVFEVATVRPGAAIPSTRLIGVVIDTGSSEGMWIMGHLEDICPLAYRMSFQKRYAAIFPDGTSWADAQNLIKRAADLREARILQYIKEGSGKERIRTSFARQRLKYGF